MQERRDVECRTEEVQDRRDAGLKGCRTGMMQVWRDAGKERCGTEWMHAGEERWGNGGKQDWRMQDRRKARKEESRTGELLDRWVAVMDGCRTGRTQ